MEWRATLLHRFFCLAELDEIAREEFVKAMLFGGVGPSVLKHQCPVTVNLQLKGGASWSRRGAP